MKYLKSIYQLKKLEEFAMKNSIGCYGVGFNIDYSDSKGWTGTIYLPIPQGDNIKDDGFSVDGVTFYEAVDKLWSMVKKKLN